MGLVFPPFSSLLFLFFCILSLCIYGLATFRHIFFPVGFLSSVSRTTWLLLVPGDQTKKLSAVMAAYLLCRCKHLYMLVFRVLILILTYLFVSRHEVRSVNTRAVHNAGR